MGVRMLQIVLFVTSLLLSSDAPSPDDAHWLERGAQVLAPFKKELKAELDAEMKEGAANAIDVCSIKAPAIAAASSSETIIVGRTSHKLRNRDNAPRPWVRPVIDAYLEDPTNLTPRVVQIEGGAVGYVEPIVTQPLCLTCHGMSMATGTMQAIADRYPDDEATGFESGEIRGFFWVEFKGD